MKIDFYKTRILDKILKHKLSLFGAVHIVGPKWCGKSTTSKLLSKSIITFQDIYNKDLLNTIAKYNPMKFLEGEKPLLIDEWQDAPTIWDAVRNYCDSNNGCGYFILTGSTSKKVFTSHSGIGRIAELKMYPMSLYESQDSLGTVSLKDMFDNKKDFAKWDKTCNLSYEDIIFLACRGGWPRTLYFKDKNDQLEIVKEYVKQICSKDIFNVDEVKRKPENMKQVLRSYARNISTLTKCTTILEDVNKSTDLNILTLKDYLNVLEKLYVIDEITAWSPNIRSASSIRKTNKRLFTDPSIATSILNLTPQKLANDLNTFGLIFENMCLRDLKIYSTELGGTLQYFRDKHGLECDCVLTLDDSRYCLIEIKFGIDNIQDGIDNLNKIESLIIEYNKQNPNKPMPLPEFKMILTGYNCGFEKDGCYIVPIGCLKD